MTADDYDYLIVGSGAGGSAAAYKLVMAGRRVLLLEKGGPLPQDGSTLDVDRVMRRGEWKSQEEWLDRENHRFKPEEAFDLGGKTKWYGAALLRFAPDEFAGDAALGLQDWPLEADALAPYYAEAEQLLDVRRFEPEPDLVAITHRLARQSGWVSTPLTLGLAADIHRDEHAAKHFDGFAVPQGLKADAEFRLLKKLEGRPEFSLLTGAEVERLIADPVQPARVAGVRCVDGREFRAHTVLLAAGALHSSRLLLRFFGGDETRPGAWAAGRFFKRHLLTAVLAFSLRPTRDVLRKTMLITHPDFPRSSVQPLGGWLDHEIVRVTFPGWLPKWLVEFFARRSYGFFLQTEDGSDERNRVTLGGAQPPRLDYDTARMPQLADQHRRFGWTFLRSLWRAGLFAVKQSPSLSGTAHACGTLVAGHDPQRSVVNAEGRVHGLENLYVVDGSVLPRIGRLNPALTIYAWSLRVADRLLLRGSGRTE